MVFASGIFLFIFLPIAMIGNWLLRDRSTLTRNVFLLAMSFFFYLESGLMQFALLLLSIGMNYLLARRIASAHNKKLYAQKKAMLLIAVTYNVGMLFVFKYLSFLFGEITSLFGGILPERLAQITLPLGISFYTFQALSYVIDVYRENSLVEKNFINVALYISFFPQLIAGPIVRWETIKNDLTRINRVGDWNEGFRRFAIGLGKKVLIANQMAVFADKAFALLKEGSLTSAFAWLGAIAYTFQIYFDFSGYSDMAIGLGRMFGFHFPENFNYPYISKSITEFWKRWHISLSSWFRDYVYIPLGGNRCTTKRMLLNLLLVWMLTGIWHGANYTFWIWGLLYFAFLMLEKAIAMKKTGQSTASITVKGNKNNIVRNIFGHVYTMLIVVLLWVIFRADTLADAMSYIMHMFGQSVITDYAIGVTKLYYKNFLGYGIVAAIGCIPWTVALRERLYTRRGAAFCSALSDICVVVVFILACCMTIDSSYNPFIYFNF